MKTITYTQKKWAMTGCLLLALGFNLSIHKSVGEVRSVDLASETADSEIATRNGVVKVTYIKKGDKTQAVVTEGTLCAGCGGSLELNTKFTANLQDLNVALLKAVADGEEDQVKISEDRSDRSVRREKLDYRDKNIRSNLLAEIEDECSDTEAEDADDKNMQLACYSEEFEKLFKSKNKSKLNESELSRFFKTNIESLIRAQIIDTRRMASGARHGSEENSIEEASNLRKETLSSLEKLISWIPAKHESIRKGLINLESKLLEEEALATKEQFLAADRMRATDPATATVLLREAQLRTLDLTGLANGLSETTRFAADRSLRYNTSNTETMTAYVQALQKNIDSVKAGMVNPLTYTPTMIYLDQNGNPVTLGSDNNQVSVNRVGNGGSNGNLQQISLDLNKPTQIPSATNSVPVTFGPVEAVTPEQVQAREEARRNLQRSGAGNGSSRR